MLSVAIVNNPVPAPIVNTTVPGTVITHVPYDNVAPSISSAQVNNNASPNSGAAATEEEAQTSPAEQNIEAEAASTAVNTAAQQAPSAQVAFLTQLLSQDASPPVQTILVQYEKLVALSNVKYKPSNAFRPVPAPTSTFGQLLQANKPTPVQSAAPPQPIVDESVSPETNAAAIGEEAAALNPIPEVSPPRQQASRNTPSSTTSDNSTVTQAPQAISAYTTTATRVDIENTELTTAVA